MLYLFHEIQWNSWVTKPNILSTNWKVCLSFVFSVVAIAQVFTIHFIMHAWVCVHVYFHHMLSSWFRLKTFIKISMCAKLQRIYVRLLWLQSTFAGRTKSHNELCAAAGNSSLSDFIRIIRLNRLHTGYYYLSTIHFHRLKGNQLSYPFPVDYY